MSIFLSPPMSCILLNMLSPLCARALSPLTYILQIHFVVFTVTMNQNLTHLPPIAKNLHNISWNTSASRVNLEHSTTQDSRSSRWIIYILSDIHVIIWKQWLCKILCKDWCICSLSFTLLQTPNMFYGFDKQDIIYHIPTHCLFHIFRFIDIVVARREKKNRVDTMTSMKIISVLFVGVIQLKLLSWKCNINIAEPLDEDSMTSLIMPDLSAAFDVINHSILMKSLEYFFGTKKKTLTCAKSYLADRTQCV